MASVHKLCTLAINLCTHALGKFSPVYTLKNSLRPVYTIDQGLVYILANFMLFVYTDH